MATFPTKAAGEILTAADFNAVKDYVDGTAVALVEARNQVVSSEETFNITADVWDSLVLVVSRRHSTTGFVSVNMQINGATTGYAGGLTYIDETGTSAALALAAGSMRLGWLGGSGAGNGGSMTATIPHVSRALRPQCHSHGFAREGSSYRTFNAGGILNSAAKVTSLKVFLESGNFDSAQLALYGRPLG